MSTIFFKDLSSFGRRFRYFFYCRFAKWVRDLRLRARLIRLAKLLLPNSQAEAAQIQQIFRVPSSRIEIVPNGFEARFAEADPNLFRQHFGINEPFVLCVGRIERRKNQHRLIQALKPTRLPLIFIGDYVSKDYLDLCRDVAYD